MNNDTVQRLQELAVLARDLAKELEAEAVRLSGVAGGATSPEPQTDEWVSVKEASRILGVHRNTINRLIKEGKLPAVRFSSKITRLSRSELLARSMASQAGSDLDTNTRNQ